MPDNQIESYERPYWIVYGEYGEEATVVVGEGGKEFPIYKARRMVMAILSNQIEKTDDEEEIAVFQSMRRQFKDAAVGDLINGFVRKWTNKKGKERFIGLVEKDQDYRTAGQSRQRRDPNYTPPPPRPPIPSSLFQFDKPTRKREPAPPVSEAERIADKMAKASRRAAEGE